MIEHFREYNELETRIRELSYKLETISHNIYDAKTISYGIQSRTTAPKSLVEKLENKDEIEKQINVLKEQKNILYDKHIEEISKINDERKRSILRCYYLLKMSIGDIGNMLKITNDRVYKLKKEAIEEFTEKIIQNNTN